LSASCGGKPGVSIYTRVTLAIYLAIKVDGPKESDILLLLGSKTLDKIPVGWRDGALGEKGIIHLDGDLHIPQNDTMKWSVIYASDCYQG
jgi:hypothetical protein